MHLTDVYRISHPVTAPFSAAHGTFIKIGPISGTKQVLKYMRNIFSDHNAIKAKLNNKSSSRKNRNIWRLNNTLVNYQWVIEEIRQEIKKLLKFNEN
jgi:hypothetical protein